MIAFSHGNAVDIDIDAQSASSGAPATDTHTFNGPARYSPGDVVPKTDFSSVNKILDDVLKAGGILEGR